MNDTKDNCAHPRMCPKQDSFRERIKTEKLSLETPPPNELVAPPKR